MPGRIIILGSGTSYDVPVIGCDCDVCRSTDPHDKRTRSAAWIQGEKGTSIIIDVGPDLRQQCLRENICHVDAVFLTHTHADHLNGIDDLRAFSKADKMELPLYASKEDRHFLRKHFEYIFAQKSEKIVWGLPQLALRHVEDGPFTVGEFTVIMVPLVHGRWTCTGYRIGNLAYLTDCSEVPDESLKCLENLDILVIDALRWNPHVTHNSITESIAVAERIHPKLTVFTHMSHDISHEEDGKLLPKGFCFAYDGMTLPFS